MMKTLLHVKASLFGDQGQSAQLAERFIARWQAAHPDAQVQVRDLNADALPHFDLAAIAALSTPEAERSAEQQALVARSDQLIEELQQADHILLAAPMYNFAVPSQLKAWIDLVARNGVTFKYTEKGPVGLLDNTPVTVLATRGGMYKDAGMDFQVPWIKQILAFMGLMQVEVIYAEGLNMASQREASLAAAQAQIDTLSL